MRDACPGRIRFEYPQGKITAKCTACGLAFAEQATDAPSFPLALTVAINQHIGFRPLTARLLSVSNIMSLKKPLPKATFEAIAAD